MEEAGGALSSTRALRGPCLLAEKKKAATKAHFEDAQLRAIAPPAFPKPSQDASHPPCARASAWVARMVRAHNRERGGGATTPPNGRDHAGRHSY